MGLKLQKKIRKMNTEKIVELIVNEAELQNDNTYVLDESQVEHLAESIVKLCNLHGVMGRSEQLKTKFTVGQKVVVCGELHTTITRIEGDKYWFKDDDDKDWFESENAITAL